jgi:hypothetical protein
MVDLTSTSTPNAQHEELLNQLVHVYFLYIFAAFVWCFARLFCEWSDFFGGMFCEDEERR